MAEYSKALFEWVTAGMPEEEVERKRNQIEAFLRDESNNTSTCSDKSTTDGQANESQVQVEDSPRPKEKEKGQEPPVQEEILVQESPAKDQPANVVQEKSVKEKQSTLTYNKLHQLKSVHHLITLHMACVRIKQFNTFYC